MQTELITNVSHDLKTPLTSIINYVDLMKRENPTDPKIQEYLRILDEKSQRLPPPTWFMDVVIFGNFFLVISNTQLLINNIPAAD